MKIIKVKRMHSLAQAGFVGGVLALAAPASQADIEMLDGRIATNIYLTQGIQSVEADSGAFDPANTETEAGFHRTRVNFTTVIRFTDWLTATVDLGEESEDFGDQFQITNDDTFLDVALLRAIGSPLAERNALILRFGQPVITTFNFRGYTDGAAALGNPLIGNSPFDIVTAEAGVGLYGQHSLGDGVLQSLGWDFKVSQPTIGEDFSGDRSFNLNATVRLVFAGGFKLGAGWLHSDGGDQFEPGPGNFANISATDAVIGDGEAYNFPGTFTGSRDTHAGLLPGISTDLWMVDFEYARDDIFMPVTVRGWLGLGKDDFSFVDAGGNQTTMRGGAISEVARMESKILGWGSEGTFYVLPNFAYLAVRYTEVENRSNGISGKPQLDRLQLGGGVWLAENVLTKAEYVRQQEERNSPGQIGDDWDGFVFEIATRF
ncbi:hypothetical protein [uncultured Marinobacter sp.]|uniref:hypothetical protein n=1 Tax=uncultured Marinobacter sp. TaxID=187379 RepID=UPI0030D6F926